MKKVALLLFAPIFLGAFQTNDEWKDKVAPELLARAEAGETVELIVLLREQADVSAARLLTTKEARANYVWQTLQQTAGRTQAGLVAELSGKGVEFRSYYLINALWVRADLDVLRSIAQRPEVSRLQVNDPVEVEEPIEETPVTTRGPDAIEWGIERINADDVWAMGYTGQGVIVGGQDTGYEWDHPALKTQYRGWDGTAADHNYNWHDAIHEINPLNNDSIVSPTNNPCGLDSAVPCDDSGHGTHTMGTMIGEDDDNQIGVAPGARWIACRNMERGYGSPATYIECFEWFLAPTDLNGQNPDPSKAPHVINNSWSCPELEGCNPDNFAFMQTAVDNLKASGVVVVVSAGNSGSQGCSSVSTPSAIFENSFTVGAVAQNDTIAGFSSRGPVLVDNSNRLKPNVTAPGVGVRSSVRNGGYATTSGTSMAGPHVAGLVALIISANPELAGQVELIEDIIEQSAVPKQTSQDCGSVTGMEIPNNTYGFGRVDALAAVQQALALVDTDEPATGGPAVEVRPNPFEEKVTLSYRGLTGETKLEVFDLQGRLIHRVSIDALEVGSIDILTAAWPAGIYFYRLRAAGGGQLSGKLVRK